MAAAGLLAGPRARAQPHVGVRLGTRRTSHLTSGLLSDPTIGPVAGPTTFSLAIRLEDEPYAVRIGFANDIALDYPISAVSACLAGSYGDGFNPPGGVWLPLTTGNKGRDVGEDPAPVRSQARDLLVRGNGGGPRVPNLAWTDWSRVEPPLSHEVPGRPVLFLRASTPAWSAPRCSHTADGFSGTAAAQGRDIVSGLFQGKDLATDPTGEARFAHWGANPFYCVQYRSRRRGATVLWGGDSHFAGDTTTGSINVFALQSCLALSTPDLPVSAANYAWGGSPSLVFLPLLHRMMEACRPEVLILQGWTANDGPSEPAAIAYADQVLGTAQRARQLGTLPILVTRFSRSSLAAGDRERMVADRIRQSQLLAASAEMPVIDATNVLDDPAHPGAFRPGLSRDGIHPNDAGHAAVAAVLTPVLRHVLAEAA